MKLGSNLGPNIAELGAKPGITTQNKAKRTNEIDFLSRLCKQGVTGSIPVTSTRFFRKDLPFISPKVGRQAHSMRHSVMRITGRCDREHLRPCRCTNPHRSHT